MNNNKLIRVTHIASGDQWAGAEVQLYTLCKFLIQIKDLDISVILLNHGTLEQMLSKNNIAVKVLDETKLNGIQIGWQLFKLYRQTKPDVIHTHRVKENILGGFTAWLVNISSLRTVHGAPEHKPGWLHPHKRLFYILDWMIGRYFQSNIVAVSDELQELLKLKFQEHKLRVVHNGVDINSLMPYLKQPSLKNHTLKKSYKIGLVGRLVPVKRIDLFIQLAKNMFDLHPEIHFKFHVYGDGPLRPALEQQIKSLNLIDTVYMEGHCINIHAQIATLDALLIISDHEGLPMTLLETMAIGVPVIAHSVGGITQTCNNNECCWLIKDNTVDEISQALMKCVKDDVERNKRILNAQKRIKQLYTAAANAENYCVIYRSLIDAS